MKLGNAVYWPDSTQAQRFVWVCTVVVLLPMTLFSWWTYLQAPSRLGQLQPVFGVSVWHEPLGEMEFDQATLVRLARTAPDWSAAQWQLTDLPNVQELGASVDVLPNAPKARAWFRIPVRSDGQAQGQQGILGLRVMASGPWSTWANGQLLQANLADWRIQLNVPLRITVPLGVQEVLLAVPYVQGQGYAVGSMLVGDIDVVDSAWQERNLLHMDVPRLLIAVSLLLFGFAVPLAYARPHEPHFKLLAFNALAWSVTNMQYVFDTTGHDTWAVWFGSVMDSAITWVSVLGLLFGFTVVGVAAPRVRVALVGFAAVSTVLTLPMWGWHKNALVGQHYGNVLVFVWALALMVRHLWRRPQIDGMVVTAALTMDLLLGVHTLFNLTDRSNPDAFFSFPLGTLTLFLSFVFVMGRRSLAALAAAEQHEAELQRRLVEQEQRLAAQHAQLQQLAVKRHLSTQHDTIMQDLHDRLGSNLTSALLQARQGSLSATDTVLLLQDLTDELRHISHATAGGSLSINHTLAELRERVQNRLRHGGIHLHWDVDVNLPPATGTHVTQHLRALLSEAMANAIKHGQAKHIGLHASQQPMEGQGSQVKLVLTDDGQGFDPAITPPGRGLPGMQQRAQAMDAQISLHSAPGQGCRLELVMPCAQRP